MKKQTEYLRSFSRKIKTNTDLVDYHTTIYSSEQNAGPLTILNITLNLSQPETANELNTPTYITS
ncbi:hypothetical protein QJS10_CPB14g01244 [Acorus calamus]|uniref:Uncharacterized protein n=1 Tax=Acorus calamus TaxID=4465 RepID=A0AAV9DDP7_ACOCL|nr:hypothetical protein QJS10_CPB14g01244 [Acorus calamus]